MPVTMLSTKREFVEQHRPCCSGRPYASSHGVAPLLLPPTAAQPAVGLAAVGLLLGGQRSIVPARAELLVAQAKRKGSAPTLDPSEQKGKGMDAEKKAELLAKTFEHLRKRYGDGSIMNLGDNKAIEGVEFTSTGCLGLDLALGGGLPRGRLVEVFGPESCGKSTLALHAVAEVQKAGGNAAYIDLENALDPKYAAAIGIDLKRLPVMQPDSGEDALEMLDTLARSSAIDLVVVDSVAALVPRAELEGEIGMQTIGLQARLLSTSLRKLQNAAARSHTTMMFINQIRNKVGVLYGSPETTTGGNALKYYASVRIDLRKKEVIGAGDAGGPAGIKVRAKVVKNKVAPPHREAMFDIIFSRGIDGMASLVDGAEAAGIISRRGSYYFHGETRLAQGREKMVEVLMADPGRAKAIEKELRERLASDPSALSGGAGGGADDDIGAGDDDL